MSTYHELGVVFLPQKDLTPSAPSWKALYAAALQSNCALLQSKWPGEEKEKTKNKNCSLLYDVLKVTTEIRATPSDAKERVWEEAALCEHTSSTNSNCLPIPPCRPWLTTRPTRTNNRIQETKHTQTNAHTHTHTHTHQNTPDAQSQNDGATKPHGLTVSTESNATNNTSIPKRRNHREQTETRAQGSSQLCVNTTTARLIWSSSSIRRRSSSRSRKTRQHEEDWSNGFPRPSRRTLDESRT